MRGGILLTEVLLILSVLGFHRDFLPLGIVFPPMKKIGDPLIRKDLALHHHLRKNTEQQDIENQQQ